MKSHRIRRSDAGNILVVTMCATVIIGLDLITYLRLVVNQNQLITRSQVWNACMPILEAGIEEALAHCEASYNTTNMTSDGWVQSGSVVTPTNWLDDCYY